LKGSNDGFLNDIEDDLIGKQEGSVSEVFGVVGNLRGYATTLHVRSGGFECFCHGRSRTVSGRNLIKDY
jgi:hypothetical protein